MGENTNRRAYPAELRERAVGSLAWHAVGA
jgi:hypothetical protein